MVVMVGGSEDTKVHNVSTPSNTLVLLDNHDLIDVFYIGVHHVTFIDNIMRINPNMSWWQHVSWHGQLQDWLLFSSRLLIY